MGKVSELFSQIVAKFRPHDDFSGQPLWPKKLIFSLLGILALLAVGKFADNYFNGPVPTIALATPKENEAVLTDDLYVRGSVFPAGSRVLINGQNVSLNGDGTFTAVLKVKEGQNILQVTAQTGRKKAEFLRLVRRDLTEEEKRLRQEAKVKEEAEAKARILSKDQEIAQVQAAYTQKEAQRVRVTEQAIKEEAGLKRIIGKVVNDTDARAFWVKVTASLLDPAGAKVEEKIAFITSFEKFLKPGEEASFETQTIEKPFDHYQVEVTWEKE